MVSTDFLAWINLLFLPLPSSPHCSHCYHNILLNFTNFPQLSSRFRVISRVWLLQLFTKHLFSLWAFSIFSWTDQITLTLILPICSLPICPLLPPRWLSTWDKISWQIKTSWLKQNQEKTEGMLGLRRKHVEEHRSFFVEDTIQYHSLV